MSALMQLRKLELLILRDLFSLREPLDTLSQHPSLQDILIQCTAASKEGSMSVFRLPKVSVFRCSGFQYEVPSEVGTKAHLLAAPRLLVSAKRHGLKVVGWVGCRFRIRQSEAVGPLEWSVRRVAKRRPGDCAV